MEHSSDNEASDLFAWWGPVWTRPVPRTILDLIQDDLLPTEVAAALWALVARRASLVVAAGPSGAGKTTLLTALLDFLPTGTRRIAIRGGYESFAFLQDPNARPAGTTLLVNEISPHLPVYLWGSGVVRVFDALGQGYALLATAHASGVEEFVGSLAGYPLRVPTVEIARISLLVLLDAWLADGTVTREVGGVATLAPVVGGGISVDWLARRLHRGAPLELDLAVAAALAARCCVTGDLAREIEERTTVLAELLRSLPADAVMVAECLANAARRWPVRHPTE